MIPTDRIKASGEREGNTVDDIATSGWCGTNNNKNGANWIPIYLNEPTIIERIRLQKVGADRGAYITKFSLRVSDDWGEPLMAYAMENGTVTSRPMQN